MDQLTQYYLQQGKGREEPDGFYHASYSNQAGRGLWSGFFSRLWRTAKPLIYSAAKAVGKQAMTSGGQVLTDLASKSPDQSVSDVARKRLLEAKQELASKAGASLQRMSGRGQRADLKRKIAAARTSRANKTGQRAKLKRKAGLGRTSQPKQEGSGSKKRKVSPKKVQKGSGGKRRGKKRTRVHQKRVKDIFN